MFCCGGLTATSAHLTKKQGLHERYVEPYLLTGYRIPSDSFWESLLSIFWLHNQFWNIWTALIPAGFCFWQAYSIGTDPDFLASSLTEQIQLQVQEIYPISLASFGLGFLSSGIYHIFASNLRWRDFTLSLDLSGVYFTAVGVVYPFLQGAFSQAPDIRRLYLAVLFLNLITGVSISQFSWYVESQFHKVAFGLASASTMILYAGHAYFYVNWEEFIFLTLPVVYYYAFVALGLFFFVSRFPEKIFPNIFDIHLQSHALWHLCIIVSEYLYYTHSLQYWQFRASSTPDVGFPDSPIDWE